MHYLRRAAISVFPEIDPVCDGLNLKRSLEPAATAVDIGPAYHRLCWGTKVVELKRGWEAGSKVPVFRRGLCLGFTHSLCYAYYHYNGWLLSR